MCNPSTGRSGNVYDGEWLCNERHGQGTMHWYDCGERYIGEWVRGVQNGQGEHVWFLRNSDSAQVREGGLGQGGMQEEWEGGREGRREGGREGGKARCMVPEDIR